MPLYVHVLLIVLAIVSIQAKNVGQRNARWFNKPYTSTVLQSSTITSLVPSSCVLLDATLPPCRNVRYLKFPQFIRNNPPSNNLIIETDQASKEDGLQASTALGWGEYLGIYAPTVTITNILFETATVQDPRIMVTFAVKGCRPLKLPMDLDHCPQEPSATLDIQEILPTSTVALVAASTSTSIVNLDAVEASDPEAALIESSSMRPTEALP